MKKITGEENFGAFSTFRFYRSRISLINIISMIFNKLELIEIYIHVLKYDTLVVLGQRFLRGTFLNSLKLPNQ